MEELPYEFWLRGSDKEHGNLAENQINRRKLRRRESSVVIGLDSVILNLYLTFPQQGSSPFFSEEIPHNCFGPTRGAIIFGRF